jgi:NAD(P)-dependent dehydrogenase (short-subunit alcohol dehydrogenase family)
MPRFTDRTAIVTGAGSGLGKATAELFAAEGAKVAVLDIAEEAADRVAAEIVANGGTATAFRSDVSDLDGCISTVEAVSSALGRPQILVNSAGILGSARSEEETAEQWRRIIAVNLDGTFFMCRATLPYLLDGGGTIVNIASNAGFMGQPFSAAYCASKGGVVNLTRALAVEYVARGVRVNAVAPGGMRTPLTKSFKLPEGASVDDLRTIISKIGVSQAEEVATCVAYVASDDARYMVGSIVNFDGGLVSYGGGFPE